MSLIYSGNTVTGYSGTFSGTVVIPSGVTSIGYAAFQGCTSLTSISLPSTLTSIGDAVFWGSGLTSITIPSSVTSIGELVFNNCSSLVSVTINGPITTIPRYTFNGCVALRTVSLPDSITSFGEAAFSYCLDLSSITLPAKLTSLGNFCFYMDTSLVNVVLDPSLTTINQYCFAACTKMQNLTFPLGLTTIGDWAFNQCNSLTSVSLPPSVNSFGIGTFSSCGNLQSAYINCAATVLPQYTFNGCVNLTTIFLPSSVQTIGNSAISYCYKLSNITIPSGTVTIDDYAFFQDASLASINMPTTLRTIGDHTFAGCTSLANLSLPVGLQTVRDWAFQGCSTFSQITIPSTVTTMGTQVFNSCTGLTTAYLDLSMTGIPDYTFTLCSNLVNLRINSSIQFVGVGAFGGCSKLLYVGLPDSVKEVKDYAFVNCEKLSFVSLNYGLTTIGDHAFSGCISYMNIMIPPTVTTVKDWAFGGAAMLRTITIPSSVTSLGNSAFGNCNNLTAIYFEGNAPTTFGTNIVSNPNIPFYYKPTATGWGSISGYNKISSTNSEPTYGGLSLSSLSSQIIIPVVKNTTNQITFSSSDLSGVNLINADATPQQKRDRVIAVTKYLISTLLQAQQGKDVIIDTSSLPFPEQITSSKIQIAPAGANISNTILNSGYAVYSPLDTVNDTLTLQSSAGPIIVTNTGTGTGYTASENGTVYNVSAGDVRTFGGIQYIIGSVALQKVGINNNLVLSQSYNLLYGTTNTTNDTVIGYDGSINGLLTIPDGVKIIGENAFLGAAGITSLSIPSSVEEIGDLAFYNTAITTLDLSNLGYTTIIKYGAFYSCFELSSVILPATVSSIGQNIFRYCTSLTSINYPTNLDYIPDGFLLNATSLQSFIVPSAVTRIGANAFYNCSNLTYLKFTGNAPILGASAIPSGTLIKYYGSSTNGWTFFIAANPQYTYRDLDDPANAFQLVIVNNIVTGYSGEISTSITIPEGITGIDNNVFMGTPITSITLPSTLLQIGNNAFNGCSGLVDITIPISVTTIGYNAFYGCSGIFTLNNLNIAQFYDILADTSYSVILTSSVTSIPDVIFSSTNITSISIPNTVTSIGNSVFEGCSVLTNITIPSSVTTIGNDAFFGITGLTLIFNGDTPIISNAFPSGTTIKYHGTTKTGWTDFISANPDYTYVDLDAAENVFTFTYSTTDTTDDTISGFTGSIPSSIVIPSGVKYIGTSIFQNQTSITSVSLPSTLLQIGNSTFEGCSGLNNVTIIIPSSVTTIGNSAFFGITGLTLTFNGNAPTLGPDAIPVGTTIKYYSGSTTGWTDFISANPQFTYVDLGTYSGGGGGGPSPVSLATTIQNALSSPTATREEIKTAILASVSSYDQVVTTLNNIDASRLFNTVSTSAQAGDYTNKKVMFVVGNATLNPSIITVGTLLYIPANVTITVGGTAYSISFGQTDEVIINGTSYILDGSITLGTLEYKYIASGSGIFELISKNNSGGNNQMSSFTVPVLVNYATTADITLNEATETVDICDSLITFRTSGTITKTQADALFSYDWVDNDVTKVYVNQTNLEAAMGNCILDNLKTWVGEKYEADIEQSTGTPLGSSVVIDSGMVAGLRSAVAAQLYACSGQDVLLSLFRQAPQLFPLYQQLSVPAADTSFNAADVYQSVEDATDAALNFSVGDKFYLAAKLRVSPSTVSQVPATVAVDASSGAVPSQSATNSFDRIFTIATTNIQFNDIANNPIKTDSAAGEDLPDYQEYYIKITVTVA